MARRLDLAVSDVHRPASTGYAGGYSADKLGRLARRWTRLATRKPSAANHREAADAHRAAADAYRRRRGGPIARVHLQAAKSHDDAALQLTDTPAVVGPDRWRNGRAPEELSMAVNGGTLLISADKRNSLPESAFALPKQRKYPLDKPGRIRNAAARLEQMRKKGKVTEAEYKEAKGRIAKAAKSHGIDSQYNMSENAFDRPSPHGAGTIHVRAEVAPGGSVHVRHALTTTIRPTTEIKIFAEATPGSDGTSVVDDGTPLTLAQSAGPDVRRVWIQLAKPGTFAGHHQGKPFTLDGKVFQELIANFKANKDGKLPIDFEHASEMGATDGTIPVMGAPACGWIHDLAMRLDGNLYALVEWLPTAREYIRDGRYCFISPAIHFNAKDRVSGKTIGAYLSSAGLTNQPFLDGMQPLAARHVPSSIEVQSADIAELVAMKGGDFMKRTLRAPAEYMPELRAGLGMHELATHDEMQEQLDRLSERCSMADADGVHQGVNLRDKYLMPLARACGMTGATTGMQDILDQVQDMIDAAIEEHEERYHGMTLSNLASTTETTEEAAMMITEADLQRERDRASTLHDQVTTLTGKLTGAEGRATTLGKSVDDALALLKAHGVACKADESLADVVKRVLEENKALLTAKAQRDEADIVRDVEVAFSDYKDTHRLQETAKTGYMLTLRRTDPAEFLRTYPPGPRSSASSYGR
jgi:hypothetical protein